MGVREGECVKVRGVGRIPGPILAQLPSLQVDESQNVKELIEAACAEIGWCRETCILTTSR